MHAIDVFSIINEFLYVIQVLLFYNLRYFSSFSFGPSFKNLVFDLRMEPLYKL